MKTEAEMQQHFERMMKLAQELKALEDQIPDRDRFNDKHGDLSFGLTPTEALVEIIQDGIDAPGDYLLEVLDDEDEDDDEMACEDCGTTEGVGEGPCPYAEDLYGDTTPVVLCVPCAENRAAEI